MTDMTPEQISAALEAGIIDKAQAKVMMSKATGSKNGPRSAISDENQSVIGNEDDMRFLRSFSDIFISIGLGLLSLGLFASFLMIGGGGIAFLVPQVL